MSQTTNLKLFKHDNPSTNENQFDVESALNQNWDKIDTAYGNLNINKVDKVEGKGLSTNDFTDELKTKLEGLNNYNDTEIKKDIEDIKSKQIIQNTKLEEIDDNQIHLTSEKASNINVQDASGQNGSIDVFGISKQETRSGKNLLENEITYASSSGVSYVKNNDGSVVVNGTANPRSSIILNTMSVLRLKANTQYRLTGCPANGSNSTYMIATNVAGVNTHYDTGNGVNFSFEEDTEVYIEIKIAAGTTISNLIFYPMVRLANNGDDTYEQYGAMPSPRFISDIENVSGDIDITTSNKNLFNFNNLENTNIITVNEDGSLTLANNANSAGYVNTGKKLKELCGGLKVGDIAYLKLITTSANNIYLQGKTNQYWIGNNSKEIIEDMLEDTVVIYGGHQKTDTLQIQITKNKLEDYEAHEGQLIAFPLEQNQKLMQDDYLANDGIHHVRDQIEFDGTENWQVSAKKYYLQISNKKTRYSLTKNKMLCSHFKETKGENANTKQGEFFEGYYATGNRNVFFNYDNGVGGLANWKSYLAQQKTAGTPVILEYELEAEEVEAYTEEQQEAHNQLQNAKTYKTVTNVFTDKADMILKYVADTKTYIDNEINSIKNQLNIINGLLSTTTTSAMLLDNMQSDLESEVL